MTRSWRLLVAVALLAGCAQDAGEGETVREYVPVTDFRDVHGIAANPEDSDEVYVATHAGLIRGKNGTWARVGGMQDDLMGFSMHPTNGSTFWTSGHPRTGGNMGVRVSEDGGFSWRTTWGASVDFHAMTVSPADPDTLWGYHAATLYRSDDGGTVWNVTDRDPPTIRALAADPLSRETLFATTPEGISKSLDGGRTWTRLTALPALGLAIDPTDARVMYAGGQGATWKSVDAGQTWSPLPLAAHVYAYLSVGASDPSTVYVASYDTSVHRSTDGGRTWTQLKAGR